MTKNSQLSKKCTFFLVEVKPTLFSRFKKMNFLTLIFPQDHEFLRHVEEDAAAAAEDANKNRSRPRNSSPNLKKIERHAHQAVD